MVLNENTNGIPNGLFQLLFKYTIITAGLLIVVSILPSPKLVNAGYGDFGAMKLCPPGNIECCINLLTDMRKLQRILFQGGPSFVYAWNLACEMRRRKRSADYDDVIFSSSAIDRRNVPVGYRQATVGELMKICCDYGCEIRDFLGYCSPFR